MQVAGASALDRLKGEQVLTTISRFMPNVSMNVGDSKSISPAAMMAVEQIGSSNKLSSQEKHTLFRLVGMVEKFAASDPKLMQQIMTIVHVMEQNAKRTYPPMSMRDALNAYMQESETLDPTANEIMNIDTQIHALSILVDNSASLSNVRDTQLERFEMVV